MYKIEKGIPIPTKKQNWRMKYPLDDMKVNDSFFVPCPPKRVKPLIKSLHSVICRKQYDTIRTFHTESVKGGFRCWRVK